MSDRTCSIDGCDRPTGVPGSARGWCGKHYQRWYNHGDPLFAVRESPRTFRARVPAPKRLTVEQRFWANVNTDGPVPPFAPQLGPCWVWTAGIHKRTGYGCFTMTRQGRRTLQAHIAAYWLLVGNIPAGLQLDHVCHTVSNGTCGGGKECQHRRCVNPAHLEPVTQQENIRRAMDAKIRCKNGHLFDEANTRWYNGQRRCRTCHRDSEERKRREQGACPWRPAVPAINFVIRMSSADVAMIDTVRGNEERSAWVRAAVLAAARNDSAIPVARKRSSGRDARISLRIPEEDVAELDAARGDTPRVTWIRAAVLAAAA